MPSKPRPKVKRKPLSVCIREAREALNAQRASAGLPARELRAKALKDGKSAKTADALARRPVRTEVAMRLYLKAFAMHANLTHSAKVAGVSRDTIYWWRTIPAFIELEDAARDDAKDCIQYEIYRRGVLGVDRPVFQLGEKVGYTREYSDSLLTLQAKGLMPDIYKERQEVTGKDGAPLYPGIPTTPADAGRMTDLEQLELLKRATEAIEAELVDRTKDQ